MAEKTMNRWLVVVGALLVQLCLGSIYSWTIFTGTLSTAVDKGGFGLTTAQAQLPFQIGLAVFAVTTIFGGKWQDKVGPRIVATTGGVLLAIGYILTSRATSLSSIIIFYSIIASIGIGLGYVCPLAAGVKWFPDKKGLITGLAVAGFGAGSFIFSKLGTSLMNSVGTTPDALIPAWHHSFLILGIIFLVGVVVGAQLLINPPAGYKPAGWNPPAATAGKPIGRDYTWSEMLGTPQFWLIWLMFLVGASAGLMVIGSAGPILKSIGSIVGGLDAKQVASMVASLSGILALFNGLGRITWGTVSDKIGRARTLTIMYLLNIVVMFCLMKATTYGFLTFGICLAGFCFGGNFAVFPTATNDFFGNKNYGNNYGFVFTSYGLGGIVGPLLATSVFARTGSYSNAFIISAALLLVAAVLSLLTKPPAAARAK